jgi:hypothetical protein
MWTELQLGSIEVDVDLAKLGFATTICFPVLQIKTPRI